MKRFSLRQVFRRICDAGGWAGGVFLREAFKKNTCIDILLLNAFIVLLLVPFKHNYIYF